MVGHGHLRTDLILQRNGKVAGRCDHCSIDPFRSSVGLAPFAVIKVILGASSVREEREVS